MLVVQHRSGPFLAAGGVTFVREVDDDGVLWYTYSDGRQVRADDQRIEVLRDLVAKGIWVDITPVLTVVGDGEWALRPRRSGGSVVLFRHGTDSWDCPIEDWMVYAAERLGWLTREIGYNISESEVVLFRKV